MWPFSREIKRGKGRPFYGLYVLVSLLCTAALVTGFAFTDRIAGLLPQSTWFVIVFGMAALAFILWVGRNGPDARWIRRQWPKVWRSRRR